MKYHELEYSKIQGKTYSLFGNNTSGNEYYREIKKLADIIFENNQKVQLLIETIHKYSSKRRYLSRIIKNPIPGNLVSDCLNLIDEKLNQYTQATAEHLKNLSFLKIWDRRLGTTREQYHLYMLEIELTNRLFKVEFKMAEKKIALLPYCLQDFSVKCKAAPNDFDYQCKHCSSKCFQNHINAILKKNNIEPYIWMGGDIKQLAKKSISIGQSFGVLGIACVPELVWGMHKCREYHVPVVGIPLDANRYKRWFGEFLHNSVNLEELEILVG